MSTESSLLPLDKNRVVTLTVGGEAMSFEFKRIETRTWRKFMESVVSRIERENGQQFEISDEQAALVELYNVAIVAARPCSLRVKAAAASVLRAVGTESVVEPTASEHIEVRLSAPWSTGPDGKMQMYEGLVHRFKQPTIDQLRRYRMGCARLLVQGDAQNGSTTYPSRTAVALGLYAELIAEVDGYAWSDADISGAKPAEIAERMDGMHAARAVLELFEQGSEEISVGGKAEATDGASE